MDPLHSLTLGDLARENRRNWPQATAVVDGDVRLTFPELDDRVNQLANALLAEGVEPGDRLLWLGQTSYQVLESLLAAAKVGAILCPANWRQSASELRFVLDDLAPRVVLWQDMGPAVSEARDAAEGKARWVRADGDGEDSYEAFLAGAQTTDPQRPVDPQSPVLALYTAAFDGTPNAAMLSHAALIEHNMSLALARQMEPGFAYLDSGPLFHVGTMMFCLATFHLGGKNVFIPSFDAAEAVRLIDAERCDGMFAYGPMIEQLVTANADGRYDLKSLHAPAGSEAWNAMITLDETPWHRAFAGYGQTEVGGMLTYAGYGVGGAGSGGRPSPLAQVRIVDPDGEEVPPGQIGEIVARGHVIAGYHNRPELTAARQAGGWHHTGDLGRREPDGTLSFLGPKLRLIKSAAENIYPVEVEKALAAHDGVAAAAVIGQPDADWGQSVVAIVVRAEGSTVTEAELIEHCRASIASYKKPRRVEFVDAIPKKGYANDYDALDAQHGGGGYPGS